jgi:hypothetical protein
MLLSFPFNPTKIPQKQRGTGGFIKQLNEGGDRSQIKTRPTTALPRTPWRSLDAQIRGRLLRENPDLGVGVGER